MIQCQDTCVCIPKMIHYQDTCACMPYINTYPTCPHISPSHTHINKAAHQRRTATTNGQPTTPPHPTPAPSPHSRSTLTLIENVSDPRTATTPPTGGRATDGHSSKPGHGVPPAGAAAEWQRSLHGAQNRETEPHSPAPSPGSSILTASHSNL